MIFYLGGVGPRVSMTGRAHPAARAAAPEPVSTTGFHLTTTGHTLYARAPMGQLVGCTIQGQSADAAAKSRGVERGEVTWLGTPALGTSLRPCLLL